MSVAATLHESVFHTLTTDWLASFLVATANTSSDGEKASLEAALGNSVIGCLVARFQSGSAFPQVPKPKKLPSFDTAIERIPDE